MAMKAASADRSEFIPYPTNRVVGTIGDAGRARSAIDALIAAGFERKDIDVLQGEGDLRRLDPTGIDHGLFAQFQRTLIRSLDLEQFKHLTHHIEDVRAGRAVIMVRTKRRGQRLVAADILHQFGAEFVGFYGRWACEEIPPHPHQTPQEIPALFTRAWNERDPDALASLFDEDAEFVNVAGLVWHDRASIRKGHADGLGSGSKATLRSDGTKVRLLSPDVAVVHTRMTLSGDAGEGASSAPRTTIVSFVVHRLGDRWLCASAQNTDVVATMAGPAMERSSTLGMAPYPGDQMA
jgi:uncharacterized protein (TIGR02246 family)